MAHFLEVVFWSEVFWRGAQKPWRTWELRGIEPAGSSGHSCGTCRQQLLGEGGGDRSNLGRLSLGTLVHMCSGPQTHRLEAEGLCGLRRELTGSGNVSV